MKSYLLLISLLVVGWINAKEPTVTIRSIVSPCLINKGDNPILAISIDVTQPTTIQQLSFTIKGDIPLSKIQKIALWKGDKCIAQTEKIAQKIVLPLQEIVQDTAKWLVTCDLSPTTTLTSTFTIVSFALKANKKKYTVTTSHLSEHRLGISVRDQGTLGVSAFRIPGLVTTNKGTLLAIYDVRYESTRDLQGHMDIGLSRSTDKGQTWERMRIVLDMGQYGGLPQKYNGVSDACILVDKNSDRIFIAGLWMHGVLDKEGKFIEGLEETSSHWQHQWRHKGSQPGFSPRETSQFLITQSSDDGKTWSAPINITPTTKKEAWWLYAPAPGNGITMVDGTLVFPTQGRDENGEPFSNITYSKDGGNTWTTSLPCYSNTTECAVVELSNGDLMLNMRDNRNRKEKGEKNGRAVFVTSDLGQTWTEHPSSHHALPEPTCMASLIRINAAENVMQKDLLLFSNPNTKKGRSHFTIKTSLDDGLTWPSKYQLLIDEGLGFGYSSLTMVDTHHVGILYEGSRSQMCFQLIPLSKITSQCK